MWAFRGICFGYVVQVFVQGDMPGAELEDDGHMLFWESVFFTFYTVYKVYLSHLVDFRQLIDQDSLHPFISPLDDPLILITCWLALQLSQAPLTFSNLPTNFGTPRTIETRAHHIQ